MSLNILSNALKHRSSVLQRAMGTLAAPESSPAPNTHFKITLRRSAIALGKKKQGTLVSLGIHRRHQTVYQKHSPVAAGKILLLKELVEVENVPEHLVKTKEEQTLERRAKRGYKVVGSKRPEI
ncbi:hypothetical protein C8J56DRAFT_1043858 [Mycena floridula]|nr:hypothetical protein C8J56DRAFT_1043858 [Mycena floridula]